MRIDHSTKIYQISPHTQQEQMLPQSVERRQTAVALDSNSRSTESASIIDAEYFEIYNLSKIALPYKPSANSDDLSTDAVNQKSGGQQQQRISKYNLLRRYQAMAADTPIAGKYLNIFA